MSSQPTCFASRILRPFALVAVSLVLSGSAYASTVTYFGIDQGTGTIPTTAVNALAARNDFVAAFGSIGVENFDSEKTDVFPTSVSFTGTAVTATGSTTDPTDNVIDKVPNAGAYATSGTQFLDDEAGPLHDTFTFSTPVSGVGMYITDLNDGGDDIDQMSLVLSFFGGGTQTITTSFSSFNNNGNLIFFGVSSTQLISSFQVLNTEPNDSDVIGIDDLTVGVGSPGVTPEPPAALLLLTGMLGVGGVAWMRRRGVVVV